MKKILFPVFFVVLVTSLFAQSDLAGKVELTAFKAQAKQTACTPDANRPGLTFNKNTYILKKAQSRVNVYVPTTEAAPIAQTTYFTVHAMLDWPTQDERFENGEDAEYELNRIAQLNKGSNLYDVMDERDTYVDENGNRNALFAYRFTPNDDEQPAEYQVVRFVLFGDRGYVRYTFTYTAKNQSWSEFKQTVAAYRAEWIKAMYEMTLPTPIKGFYSCQL